MTQDIKWGHDLCFNIAEKMFLVIGPDNVPVSASFKAADEAFEELNALPDYVQAPYLARYKWVHVDDLNLFSRTEWEKLLRTSYELISAKLPAKKRKELGF